MKENKEYKITVRLNETQYSILQKIIDDGKAKNQSTALQYLLNTLAIKGSI